MALVNKVIQNAYRKAGIIPLGATVAAQQSATGLDLLMETYSDLVTKGTLGVLRDVYTTSNCTAQEWTRIYATTVPLVITLPVTVKDANTGLYRAPLDGAVISVVGPGRTPQTVIYDALTATWEDLITLPALTASAPLTTSYQSDIEALLAGKLADERGIPIGLLLSSQIRSARYHLARRTNRASSVATGDYM